MEGVDCSKHLEISESREDIKSDAGESKTADVRQEETVSSKSEVEHENFPTPVVKRGRGRPKGQFTPAQKAQLERVQRLNKQRYQIKNELQQKLELTQDCLKQLLESTMKKVDDIKASDVKEEKPEVEPSPIRVEKVEKQPSKKATTFKKKSKKRKVESESESSSESSESESSESDSESDSGSSIMSTDSEEEKVVVVKKAKKGRKKPAKKAKAAKTKIIYKYRKPKPTNPYGAQALYSREGKYTVPKIGLM